MDDTDDEGFFQLVGNAVSNLVDRLRPEEFFVVRIDNWFDHKWLKFSGKAVIPFPVGEANPSSGWPWIESALEERYRDQVTFPPFNPNRILRQQYFRRDGAKK